MRLPEKLTIPLALLLACALAYGGLIHTLGFYDDEWHMLYAWLSQGSDGISAYFHFDGHPTIAWAYQLSFQLLGVNPLAWQVYNLFLRWVSVVAFWLLLDRVWPLRRLETFFAALVFALYPRFAMQAMAISYFEVWFSYAVLWGSVYFNILALQKRQAFWPFFLLSLGLKIAHLFTSEYTWGAELMRPLLLWFALDSDWRARFWAGLKASLLPVALSAGMFFWRVFIYASPVESRAQPRLINALQAKPIETITELFLKFWPDLAAMLLDAWGRLLRPAFWDWNRPFNLLVFILSVAAALAFYFFARNLAGSASRQPGSLDSFGGKNLLPGQNLVQNGAPRFVIPWLITGLWGVLTGLLPFYVAGYTILGGEEPSNGRLTLGALAGIPLVAAALFSFFVTAPARRALLFALLTGLMIGAQNHAADLFRAFWVEQQDLHRQLALRIPAPQPGAALVFDRPASSSFLDRARVFSVNALYFSPAAETAYPYWAFSLTSSGQLSGWSFTQDFPAVETSISDGKYEAHFTGGSADFVLLSFHPEEKRCLWLLDPYLAEYLRLPVSLPNRPAYASTPTANPRLVFGGATTASRDWCFFYQQAALAADLQDWPRVASLEREARDLRESPGHALENIPFIIAHARQADWQAAESLTRKSLKLTPDAAPVFCRVWQDLLRASEPSPEREVAFQQINLTIGCRK